MQDSAIGENLRTHRIASGLTQVELAATSGVSLRTIQMVEKGAGTTVSTLLALASALGISAGVLIDSPTEPAEDVA